MPNPYSAYYSPLMPPSYAAAPVPASTSMVASQPFSSPPSVFPQRPSDPPAPSALPEPFPSGGFSDRPVPKMVSPTKLSDSSVQPGWEVIDDGFSDWQSRTDANPLMPPVSDIYRTSQPAGSEIDMRQPQTPLAQPASQLTGEAAFSQEMGERVGELVTSFLQANPELQTHLKNSNIEALLEDLFHLLYPLY